MHYSIRNNNIGRKQILSTFVVFRKLNNGAHYFHLCCTSNDLGNKLKENRETQLKIGINLIEHVGCCVFEE